MIRRFAVFAERRHDRFVAEGVSVSWPIIEAAIGENLTPAADARIEAP
jgi:hypothetical protein